MYFNISTNQTKYKQMTIFEEIDKIHNKRELEESMTYLIQEELGISNTVLNNSKLIINNIKLALVKTKSKPFSEDGLEYKTGLLPKNEYIDLPDVEWRYFDFPNEDSLLKHVRNIAFSTKYNQLTDKLTVAIFAIKGVIEDRTLYDSVAHELEHRYQIEQSGDNLIRTDKSKTIYSNIISLKNTNNKVAIAIGDVLYASYKFEQDAFIHGAYEFMMQKNKEGIDPYVSYKETDAYAVLLKLKYGLGLLSTIKKEDKNKISSFIKQTLDYNSLDDILTLGEKALKRYSRKLARMYSKVIKDTSV